MGSTFIQLALMYICTHAHTHAFTHAQARTHTHTPTCTHIDIDIDLDIDPQRESERGRKRETERWRDKRCTVLKCVPVCCSVLQCVAVCSSVLQCVAVRRKTVTLSSAFKNAAHDEATDAPLTFALQLASEFPDKSNCPAGVATVRTGVLWGSAPDCPESGTMNLCQGILGQDIG